MPLQLTLDGCTISAFDCDCGIGELSGGGHPWLDGLHSYCDGLKAGMPVSNGYMVSVKGNLVKGIVQALAKTSVAEDKSVLNGLKSALTKSGSISCGGVENLYSKLFPSGKAELDQWANAHSSKHNSDMTALWKKAHPKEAKAIDDALAQVQANAAALKKKLDDIKKKEAEAKASGSANAKKALEKLKEDADNLKAKIEEEKGKAKKAAKKGGGGGGGTVIVDSVIPETYGQESPSMLSGPLPIIAGIGLLTAIALFVASRKKKEK